jgi:hypothetical protein
VAQGREVLEGCWLLQSRQGSRCGKTMFMMRTRRVPSGRSARDRPR